MSAACLLVAIVSVVRLSSRSLSSVYWPGLRFATEAVVEGINSRVHCQKEIASNNLNGLCLEDTGPCGALPTVLRG